MALKAEVVSANDDLVGAGRKSAPQRPTNMAEGVRRGKRADFSQRISDSHHFDSSEGDNPVAFARNDWST